MMNGIRNPCPFCDVGKVEITHSFSAGTVGRTSQGICDKCFERVVYVQIVIGKMEGNGTGASAISKRLVQAESDGRLEAAREIIRSAPKAPDGDRVRGDGPEGGEGRSRG